MEEFVGEERVEGFFDLDGLLVHVIVQDINVGGDPALLFFFR